MFRRLSEPLPLSEAGLLGLRPALNAPVLHWSGLPHGPARAAVVVFAESGGGLGLALGIRSLETGAVVMFRNRAFLDAQASVVSVMATAVSEAERLGFVFAEDLVASGREEEGRARAAAFWAGLAERPFPGVSAATENAGQSAQGSGAGDPAIGAPMSELLLDEVAEGELPEIPLETIVAVPSVLPTQAGSSGAQDLPLSDAASLPKFRGAQVGVRESDLANRLGRIPLVRIRRSAPVGRRLPYLARLLSSF